MLTQEKWKQALKGSAAAQVCQLPILSLPYVPFLVDGEFSVFQFKVTDIFTHLKELSKSPFKSLNPVNVQEMHWERMGKTLHILKIFRFL